MYGWPMALRPIAVPKDVEVVVGFALKVVMASLAFFLVALVAVVLKAGLEWAEHLVAMPQWFLLSASWVEIAIWVADIIVYVLFLISEVRDSLVGTVKRWRTPHG